ncbi:unnamed protein product [Trichogramma brassicae]|uniref:Protein rolling stone n=1 Tax=Trichogramma brassicae TaxID=86971 RepID=A0A6H5I5T9_9HYME|nr:unnamed protein product [Trichogramma brassicae]
MLLNFTETCSCLQHQQQQLQQQQQQHQQQHEQQHQQQQQQESTIGDDFNCCSATAAALTSRPAMKVYSFRALPSPKACLLLFGHVCSRRRAMVNKLWFRELARKSFLSRGGKAEPPRVRRFTEPRSHSYLHPWYLCYRWAMFGLWLAVCICSFFEIGSVEKLGYKEKWLIYLTNWDLALGLVQSFLGVCLVCKRWRLQTSKPDFDPAQLEYGLLERTYWFLYIVTSSLAIGVTVSYWGLVHNPKIHHVDTLNILIHVINSLLMLVDFFAANVPFEMRSFWWAPLFVSGYIVFSIVYYLAGGLDKRGKPRIYDVLDWQKPLLTSAVCLGGLLFLCLTHCLLHYLARLRDRAYLKKIEQLEPANGCNQHK